MAGSRISLPTWKEVTSGSIPFPALAGWSADPKEFAIIRGLTESEAKTIENYGKIYSDIESRMNLLKIVDRNFQELCKFTSSHTPSSPTNVDYKLELDRLILNYLSSGYGLHEQIKSHMAKQSPQDKKKFREFAETLESKNFAYAFFRDFRNYAQHCELSVGRVTVTTTTKGTTMQVIHSVEDLVRDYKKWGKSKLDQKTGELDLLRLLKEYNKVLLEDYGNYLANYFVGLLLPIHEFAARLTQEVKTVKPNYQLLICTEVSGDGVNQAQFECAVLPEDVLRSLNIKLEAKQAP